MKIHQQKPTNWEFPKVGEPKKILSSYKDPEYGTPNFFGNSHVGSEPVEAGLLGIPLNPKP